MHIAPLHEAHYWPNAAPSPGIPLGARSVGHYRVPLGWTETRRPRHFIQIFRSICGRGILEIEGAEHEKLPGETAIYLPGMEHRLRALDSEWEYRWRTMDGPLAMQIVTGFGLKAGLYLAGKAPLELFESLKKWILDVSADGEQRAGAAAYELLSRIPCQPRPDASDPLITEALRIMHRQWTDPLMGVEFLAKQLGHNRCSLSRRFRAFVGVPQIEYLTRLRVQHGMALLRQTALSVAEVARRCGYSDPNYFSRLIRQRTDLAPLEFRKR